jgi:hypothetical protein
MGPVVFCLTDGREFLQSAEVQSSHLREARAPRQQTPGRTA